MLTQRSINKIGKHLEQEGWTDDEIETALSEMDLGRGVVNVAMPDHFREEAEHHARCHCKYVLRLKEGSAKYDKAYHDAYSTYLIEAYENSRGIEGPNSGSHKKSNPAGVEVFAFDEIGTEIVSQKEKEEIASKASSGLVFMGRDKLIQDTAKKIYSRYADKELVKNVMTQYSAAVVSLSNTYLFAFGGYKTKRKYSGTRLYNQNEQGVIDAENTMEFSKGQSKEKMLEVAYRQITRQIYIIALSSIIAGTMILDETVVKSIENGVEDHIKKLWDVYSANDEKQKELNLAFILKRETRNAVIKSFYSAFEKTVVMSPSAPREFYLSLVKRTINNWAGERAASKALDLMNE